jgi:hypothetical protein
MSNEKSTSLPPEARIRLSSAGLGNIQRELYLSHFTFLISGRKFVCPSFIAEFLSPRVSRMRTTDSTIQEFAIDVDDPTNEFSKVFGLGEGLDMVVTNSNRNVVKSICSKLGNRELLESISDIFEKELNSDNVLARLMFLTDNDLVCETEVDFASSHFGEFLNANDSSEVNSLSTALLLEIISRPSLKLKSEDSLWTFLVNRFLRSSDPNVRPDVSLFLPFIKFEYLSTDVMTQFCAMITSSFDFLTPAIWASLQPRLVFPVSLASDFNRHGIAGKGKLILPNSNDPLKGIISYLTEKHGGNVHDRQVMNLTASSVQYGQIQYLCELHKMPPDRFQTCTAADQWICYDFKNMRVQLLHYTLRSALDGCVDNYNPKNWVIDGSTDGNSWITLDRRDNNSDINGADFKKTFTIAIPQTELVRFVRFRLIGKNHAGNTAIMLQSWELFGHLYE